VNMGGQIEKKKKKIMGKNCLPGPGPHVGPPLVHIPRSDPIGNVFENCFLFCVLKSVFEKNEKLKYYLWGPHLKKYRL